MIDVILPARNEEKTIGPILDKFRNHPYISDVIVCVDAETTDTTEQIARQYSHKIVSAYHHISGKGQLLMAGLALTRTPYVMFCDTDYTGLTPHHIAVMTGNLRAGQMVIGVPEFPEDVPDHVISAWPWVSGIRVVPLEVIVKMASVTGLQLHGYLTEIQLNMQTRRMKYSCKFHFLPGLQAPYTMTRKRIEEMTRDRKWGIEHGVFSA